MKNNDLIVAELKQLANLYTEVKPILMLSETVSRQTSITALNEIRNSFEHVIRGIINHDHIELEIRKSKDHLNQAVFDAYQITIIEIIEKISADLRQFSSSTISSVFPEYYKELKPKLIEVQTKLSNSRTNKKSFGSMLKYEENAKLLEELLSFQNIVSSMIPALNEFKKNSKRKNIKSWIINILIGVISALVTSLIIIFLK